MTVVTTEILNHFNSYITNNQVVEPLFIQGNSCSVLELLPDNCIDFCMTSPPYWGKRQYNNGGFGLEANYREYITHLLSVFAQIKRILKPTGSFWLNIGDSYLDKHLIGIPWRVTLRLTDEQGWVLRNSIIWNKVKGGPDTAKDRLRNIHENIYHFVKTTKCYYYDVDAIRANPRKAKVVNGAVISATGVTGVRYMRQIEMSTALNEEEKKAALGALEKMLEKIRLGEVADFRMIIRGQQRTTHSDSELVSGRARELKEKGFYFLKYHPNGSKPSDIWNIIPEDTQKREDHYAPYPEDLCMIPLLSTCPTNGIALDPFCGTGTTMLVAKKLGRKSIGIDISEQYLQQANKRCTRS